MKSPDKLLRIISEEIRIFETEVDTHAYDRVKERLDLMTANGDITSAEDAEIRRNLENIIAHNFDSGGYGIFLGSFVPKKTSSLYTDRNEYDRGIPFYQIYSNDGIFAKDSTGDEMWAIVRDNRLKTVMLRKALQRRSMYKDRNDDGGLGVETPVPDFDKFLQNIERERQMRDREKLLQKDKEQIKLKQLEKTVNIKGVSWVIDDAKQIVYKKNNPNTFVKFDDVLEYPDWDDKTKEDILNRIG